jgi:GTP cyclohydrolase II
VRHIPVTSCFAYKLKLEYFRYLVYNLRKRGGDSADKYFKSTELIAGVKDMRFQALMPDILHWFGIRKIDNMVSMSDM